MRGILIFVWKRNLSGKSTMTVDDRRKTPKSTLVKEKKKNTSNMNNQGRNLLISIVISATSRISQCLLKDVTGDYFFSLSLSSSLTHPYFTEHDKLFYLCFHLDSKGKEKRTAYIYTVFILLIIIFLLLI